MVQELEKKRQGVRFPETAPAANPVFFRTYSRRTPAGLRETWDEVCDRTIQGLVELGKLTPEEAATLTKTQRNLKSLPSGRWLWVGGTDWISQAKNFSGAYNCTSTNLKDWKAFGLMMDLAMMGCGTGAIIEPQYINQLPPIRNRLHVTVRGEVGNTSKELRREHTQTNIEGNSVTIYVGDSREGWVKSYQTLLELSTDERFTDEVQVIVDISDVRQAGETLQGFGGVANPVKLPGLYQRCATILNKALGRQLNSVECCLLIDEAAVTIVAGNIRRCLPEDALVHTSKGLVPICDVQVGDLVQTPLGFRRVVDKFDQGLQDVYEIETNATYPRATLNHRQAVLADAKGGIVWKYVNSLVEGDRLLHNKQVLPGTVTHLPPDFTESRPSQTRTAKTFVVPELTAEVAWLIGFTHGDGYVALGHNQYSKPYGRVEWSMNSLDAELTSRIQAKINAALALFGLSAVHSITKGENTAKSICSSIRLAEYFHQHIKQPNVPLVVPSFILQGSVDIRAAYLAGLMDSNGGVNNRPPHLVTSVYRSFIRQVSVVLSSLGIAGRLTTTYPQNSSWQVKYNLTIPALKERYNSLIAPHSAKGELRQGLKMYGFTVPGAIMREAYTYSEMREMGFQGSRTVDANYERYITEGNISLDIPVTVKGLGSYDHVQTYDIEVEEAHCFYCDGYLTHNSAGMRQFTSDDEPGATAKDNLWQQDENGNWRIDPERDALRMANHTRVFHRKPTLEECINAVRKQYYSGEGAIQWAGEAVARANCDLLTTPALKKEFLQAYEQGNAKQWLQERHPEIDANELEHRLGRYGLNPCITSDTWIHTEQGARQVKDLIGKQLSVYVNGELFSTTTDGFWFTGVKPILKVITQEGYELRLTENHQLLKVTAQTQKKQYTQWVETQNLSPGDYILVHNHRGLQPWDSFGTFDEGWLIGNLIGDGSIASTQWGRTAYLRYWQDSQEEMGQYAVALLKKAVNFSSSTTSGCYHQQLKHRVISSSGLAKLAADYGVTLENKMPTDKIEQASYEFYRGFLRGLFDADGSVQGNQQKGVSVRLAQSNLETLQIVQRMLARLGIISTIYQQRRPESYRHLPDSNRELALYACKAQHELVISNDNLYYFQKIVGFQEPQKAKRLQELLSGYRRKLNNERFAVKVKQIVPDGFEGVYDCTVPGASQFDANGIVAHNCGEIIGSDFHCNLAEIHLNQIDPLNYKEQEEAFTAGALSVAALLNHKFQEPRYQYSRELDPIVGVSFTGLFDFFVHAFGVDWLRWWEAGRPETPQGLAFKHQEEKYLTFWKEIVERVVWDYCDRHHLKRPNRCTTVQPSGTKSLLTGASPGWHPPKAQRFIRRITFRKNDPVALACLDYGYSVIPSQSDKDEQGNLLNDPFDPRVTEWLVEIPVAVSWADLPGADVIDISKFNAIAQMDFYMQVQKFYVTHNTSATIELREHEVEALGTRIWEAIHNDEGYMSAALLARFDDHQTFPRLPFEPISKEKYDQMMQAVASRRKTDDFYAVLSRYDFGELMEVGPAGCDSDKCMMPEPSPN
ncbi:ribonucleoside-triphosphate reductase, adenosylcobalamin-dependent [Anabaena sp. CA = ATCC 33047]|uniref:ribonucleoside-triphosphate reductase, adenosylcobalamin-dependent n=1 Tax=Anabaena sp. (strain CA / ATCC 33047) TaxID=52271 RepID=UPI00083410A4|nr:ribonucleoside-triphosphate reductase, adenosylcobalamin-dependent [Anabaena sp. CA = ATCC 33047]